MIRRLGYRRILPISQLALYLALVSFGAWQLGGIQPKRLQQVSFQESPGLPDWRPQTNTMPAPWLLAIAINVPAAMLGAIFAEMLHIGSNFTALLCSSPFVLLLWQLFGRWLDRQIGYLPFRPPGIAARVVSWVGIVFSAVLLAIGILAFRSHEALNAEVFALAVGWLAWSFILFLMCTLTLRRPRVAES